MNFFFNSLIFKYSQSNIPFFSSKYNFNFNKIHLNYFFNIFLFNYKSLELKNSNFNYFLNKLILKNQYYTDYTNSFIYIPSTIIQFCTFNNMNSRVITDNSLNNLNIYYSIFNNCFSTGHGGCIYKTNSNFSLKYNCFFYCHGGSGSSYSGNAVFFNQINLIENIFNTFLFCWKDSTKSAFTLRGVSNDAIMESINTTNCITSLYSFTPECSSNNLIIYKFYQLFKCSSNGGIHPNNQNLKIFNTNYIQNYASDCLFAFYLSNAILENVFFYQNTIGKLHCYNIGTYINCYGDISFSGIYPLNTKTLLKFQFLYTNNCLKLKINSKQKQKMNIKFLLFLISFY